MITHTARTAEVKAATINKMPQLATPIMALNEFTPDPLLVVLESAEGLSEDMHRREIDNRLIHAISDAYKE